MYWCLHSPQFISATPFCLRGSCVCRLTLSLLSFPIKVFQDKLCFSGCEFTSLFSVTASLPAASCPSFCTAPVLNQHTFFHGYGVNWTVSWKEFFSCSGRLRSCTNSCASSTVSVEGGGCLCHWMWNHSLHRYNWKMLRCQQTANGKGIG